MIAAAAILTGTARLLRRVRRARRFDRVRASRKLYREVLTYWSGGIDALFTHLQHTKGWDRLARHVQGDAVDAVRVEKALTEKDRQLIIDLLAGFSYYDDVETVAAAIVEATRQETFEEAAKFALRQLGIAAADFSLRNETIRAALLERVSAEIFATRNNIAGVMESMVRQFYELGRNPYDRRFLADLRQQLGDVTMAQAKRFALTETAIAAELAQLETFRRNGVQRKKWNALGQNTRPSHQAMDGAEAGIDEKFALASDDGNTYLADSPSDPSLPPHELINCRCWMSPVVNDEFQIDPARIWEGQ